MTDIMYEDWQPVIGLEIHVQLNTKTKIFSPTLKRFGDEPNSNIGPVDTGQPGTLPVLNEEAVKKAVQFGLAIKAEISEKSLFDRKSYFYPDSPRNFQITQFFHPIIRNGTLICDVEGHTKHFAIKEAHLEDDSGMLKHFNQFAAIDYNRAGMGLLEIVSEPCMHTPKEAAAYAMGIRAIMQFLDASDCNMEEGSLRIDVNVSVRPKNEKELRNKIEVKNINSFHNMQIAIESEIRRQVKAYTLKPHEDPNLVIRSGTYRFDAQLGETVLMRRKEEAQDYRYFPEPDLPPLLISIDYIEKLKSQLPELPHDRFKRYVEKLELSADSSSTLVSDKYLSDFFEKALEVCNKPASVCNWIIVEFAGRLKEKGISLKESGLTSENVGQLVKMIHDSVITGKIAKLIADEMVKHPEKDCRQIVQSNPDYQPLHDLSEIEPIVNEVLAKNPESIADYKAGKTKAFAFLVGQVMKQTRGKAAPDVVNQLLKKKIEE